MIDTICPEVDASVARTRERIRPSHFELAVGEFWPPSAMAHARKTPEMSFLWFCDSSSVGFVGALIRWLCDSLSL